MSNQKSLRAWRFYLTDMLQFAERAQHYLQGYTQATFAQDQRTYDATLRNLELLGVAATHIPQEIRNATPQVPWRLIVGLRNQLIHGYPGIDDDTIWSVIDKDIPTLIADLRELLAGMP